MIFDNASLQQKDIKNLVYTIDNVKLIYSKENIGIAAALNRLIKWGYDKKYKWMLSLDQDSICPNDYIDHMFLFLTVRKNIGILAPVIVDRNIGVVGHNPQRTYSRVNTCITSGTITSVAAWNIIGGYDEYMFIDLIDFEFCYHMRKVRFFSNLSQGCKIM